ncbi:DUF6289 family protein [Caulobacter sp.]|uniref:DUF6289 family protein n=1 Tax=Caulobacter sp. TaxID=78 RepID=UPI001B250AE5|nr:DUF6289 family protein [Caulobacter sp.]MBO9543205.1 hypothetical protein [Caulobacter sp.]
MIRKLATTIALAGSVALSFLPAAALAAPPFGWDRTYYDDASYTTEVGAETRYCNGYTNLYWGVKTPYYVTETFPCE